MLKSTPRNSAPPSFLIRPSHDTRRFIKLLTKYRHYGDIPEKNFAKEKAAMQPMVGDRVVALEKSSSGNYDVDDTGTVTAVRYDWPAGYVPAVPNKTDPARQAVWVRWDKLSKASWYQRRGRSPIRQTTLDKLGKLEKLANRQGSGPKPSTPASSGTGGSQPGPPRTDKRKDSGKKTLAPASSATGSPQSGHPREDKRLQPTGHTTIQAARTLKGAVVPKGGTDEGNKTIKNSEL